MGLFDRLLRRKPKIAGREALAHFIGEQAAFLVQKGIYDYSRARSGHFSKIMLADAGFQSALNRSRWRAFPLGLAMVGESVDATLSPNVAGERRTLLDPLIGLILSIYDQYPCPQELSEEEWQAGRSDLLLHLERLSTHAPKRIIDIPVPFAERYFAMMPFDKSLLTPDAPTAQGFMQLQLIKVQEELADRIELEPVLRELRAP
ncbi:MAG TPA: hypothetical protein PL193_07320 [Xanthobacteraceae bacterium]|nr:hypothetical protein [Xanthobacteraceae bacterium]